MMPSAVPDRNNYREKRMSRPSSRRAITGLLTLALAFTLAAPAMASGAFIDDDGSLHEADIDFIASLGITLGCNPPTNNRYCPDDFVTRQQMASFIVRTFDLGPGTPDRFVDTDDSVHKDDIDSIAAVGITLGCNPPDGDRFCPNDFVTRAQMASFIIRAMGDVDPFHAPIFGDVPRGGPHTADINALAGVDITKGCAAAPNALYCPTQFVTRAQMASFLARYVRLADDRPPTVAITSPAHLSTYITTLDPTTGRYTAEVTLTATASDPDGQAITSYHWYSSDQGFLGSGTPLTVTLAIPLGQTSAQPYISVVATASDGYFSGAEIQIKLIRPSP